MSQEKEMEVEEVLKAFMKSLIFGFDEWINSKVDRLAEKIKPSLEMHAAALEKNAEASMLLASRLTDYIEHQFHAVR